MFAHLASLFQSLHPLLLYPLLPPPPLFLLPAPATLTESLFIPAYEVVLSCQVSFS